MNPSLLKLIAEQSAWAVVWVVLGYIQVDQLGLEPTAATAITGALALAKNVVATKVPWGNPNSTSLLPRAIDPKG